MLTKKELYEFIDNNNGEIRIQSVRYVRYGGGWYCLVVTFDTDDEAFERFESLVGGDMEAFEAEEYFKNAPTGIYLATGDTPEAAMESAFKKAAAAL